MKIDLYKLVCYWLLILEWFDNISDRDAKGMIAVFALGVLLMVYEHLYGRE